jgi:hypothetical protein
MKNLHDGILASIEPNDPSKGRSAILALDLLVDVSPPRTVSLIHLAGFAGCGKTAPIARLLQHKLFRNYRIAVPTTELRSDWKQHLATAPSDAWRVSTWESALLKHANILVVDEIYKMPRGYLDLAITADSTLEFVIILGDPLQGEYHSTHPQSTNHKLSPETEHLAPYIDFYCLWSHRIPQNVASFFQITSFNKNPGFLQLSHSINPKTQILCSSTNTARTLADTGYSAITIAASQGATFSKPVTVLLDNNTSKLSPNNALVALTRSKFGIIFSGSHSCTNSVFQKFKTNEKLDLLHQFPCLKQFRLITEPLTSRLPILVGASPQSSKPSPPPSHILDPHKLQSIGTSPNFEPKPLTSSGLSDSQLLHYHKQLFAYTGHLASAALSVNNPNYSSDVILTSNSSKSIIIGDGSTNAPQISTHFLPETRRPLHFDVPSTIFSSTSIDTSSILHSPSPFEPVYPGISFETLASNFLPALDPSEKEKLIKNQYSNQFPFLNNPSSFAPQPLSLVAPIHSSRNDPTLLPASISKRLRFRPSDHPYHLTSNDHLLAQLLFEAHCRAYQRNPNLTIPFDPSLFAECIALNEFSQLSSKTQSVIMANAFRSDPDWRYTAVKIFAKTQHKINEGSIFGPWKACQTLALMHDALILLLGPVKKYQRIFDSKERPPHIYIHAGHTPFELATWCQEHLTNSIHIANDYTSFDQSQHGEAVLFEIKKMTRLNIPQNLIDLHLQIKTSITTQFGPLTCMRLTGEPGTYDDNSDYNLAVIFLKYLVTNQPILISGDDSLIDSAPPISPFWPACESLLHLAFKTESSPYGLFCGYYVGPQGAVRSPLALFTKLAVALDDGSYYEKLPSYLTEFAIGHSLGDEQWRLFPTDQVLYQSANFDFFCRYASRQQKILLKLGEADLSLFSQLSSKLTHASHSFFCLLDSATRSLLLKTRRSFHSYHSPDSDFTQRELLSNFQ